MMAMMTITWLLAQTNLKPPLSSLRGVGGRLFNLPFVNEGHIIYGFIKTVVPAFALTFVLFLISYCE